MKKGHMKKSVLYNKRDDSRQEWNWSKSKIKNI